MGQHDKIKLSPLERRQPCDSLDRLRIGDGIDETFCPQAVWDELPAIPAIVQHSRDGPLSVAKHSREVLLPGDDLHRIVANAFVSLPLITELVTMPRLEIRLSPIARVQALHLCLGEPGIEETES